MKDPAAIHQIARRVPSLYRCYALSPLAGGALQQPQHVLVAVAGHLGHALLTGAVRRNVYGELALSLYIETPLRRQAAEGVVSICFEEARVGECAWVQKFVSRASF